MIKPVSTFEEYQEQYAKSVSNPEQFWSEIAETFVWKHKWNKVLDWNFTEPNVKWFVGGELNITENCLDRHLAERGNQTAIIWEPNDPKEQGVKLTYKDLHEKVCQFANALKSQRIRKGDRVCIYMPMVPELAIAVLACARIGAIHSVVFAGFSARSLTDRINDATCNAVITADGAFRGTKEIDLKDIVDEALSECPSVQRCIVLKRTGATIHMQTGRDVWWHDVVTGQASECPAALMNSEDMLFILYTSGSTGKPKGVVHTCGGYMVYAEYSFRNVFQIGPPSIPPAGGISHDSIISDRLDAEPTPSLMGRAGEELVYFCTADIGWITGHSYIVYGPLLSGATTLMFEGIPTYPDAGRFWQIVDKYKVNIFYTAPTAIRSLEAAGLDFVKPYKLDSLRVLGSVGEPINEEAWHWYNKNIGKEKCPIVDTWWQTETGGIMISPLAGITPLKPGFATLPLPGIQPILVDSDGRELEGNDVSGNLCIKFPWPGMIRTTYGDHERCKQAYFSTYNNLYFTGDGCKRDEGGYYRITGRVDDVINVSGHRIGTAEVEAAINENPVVVESAVVGFPHNIKGQGIYAFVICAQKPDKAETVKAEIAATVSKIIGPIAKPDKVQFVSGLPKTRSGKIMRRILRKIAEGDTANLGDTSTLLDPAVVEEIKQGAV